eukprot:1179584-Prymnesium_polylepis.1
MASSQRLGVGRGGAFASSECVRRVVGAYLAYLAYSRQPTSRAAWLRSHRQLNASQAVGRLGA